MTARVVRPVVPSPGWRSGGWYTDPCRAWWGPGWRPYGDWGRNEVAISDAASRGRDTQLSRGYTGSIVGISKAAAATTAMYKAHAKKGQK